MRIDGDGESAFIIHSIGGTARRSTAGLPPRGQFDITGAREPKALQVATGFGSPRKDITVEPHGVSVLVSVVAANAWM